MEKYRLALPGGISKEKLTELMDFIPMPIFLHSVLGHYTRVNSAARELILNIFGTEELFHEQLRTNSGLYKEILKAGNLKDVYSKVYRTGSPVKDHYVSFQIDNGSDNFKEVVWLYNINLVTIEGGEGSDQKFNVYFTVIEDVSKIFNYNKQLHYSLQHLEGVIEAFAKERIAYLLAYGQKETVRHLLEVRTFSKMIAYSIMKDKNLMEDESSEYGNITVIYIKMLELSALLHDFGKVKPDINNIIMQPRKLTETEYEKVKTHTIIGSDLIGLENEMLKMCWLVTRHHHEKWDGSGYPDGLEGRNIPLSARIVAFADMFSALKNKRAYKDAIEDLEEIKVIFLENEQHYDPVIFRHGMGLLESMNEKSKTIDEEYRDFKITSEYIVDLLTDVFNFISSK